MKKLIIILLIIISVLSAGILIPVKSSMRIEDAVDGYVLVVEQTTGPWWRVIQIIGDNEHNLSINELVYIEGFDPYRALSRSVIASFQNTFVFRFSAVNTIYDEELRETFKVLTVETWDICYPIKRELGMLSYSRNYLNIFDFRWFNNDTSQR